MKGTRLRRNDEAEQIAKLEEEVEAEKRQRRKLPTGESREDTEKDAQSAQRARARGLALEAGGASLGPRGHQRSARKGRGGARAY